MPIACVDAIVVRNGSFLLVKRTNKPAQGAWWFPGGRVLKGEFLVDAVKRKVKEEIGLDVMIKQNLGCKETLFPDGPFGEPTHTINIVYLCSPLDSSKEIELDAQSEVFEWFTNIDHDWDPYVKEFLLSAGFHE